MKFRAGSAKWGQNGGLKSVPDAGFFVSNTRRLLPSPSGVRSSRCWGGVSVWGVGLAVRRFLCAGKYVTPLTMSGAALSTRLMGELRFRGSCS